MTGFIIRTAIGAAALWLIAGLSGGQIEITSFGAAIVAALVLGLANAVVKPILYSVAKGATCVLTCVTLGLWSLLLSWLLNAALFYFVGRNLEGFRVHSFWAALWGALVLSCVNALATVLTRSEDEKE